MMAHPNPPTLVPATATALRLRALAAIGYSWANISARLGVTKQYVSQLANQATPTVHEDTANRVRDLYDDLCDVPGPCNRSRADAARRGWLDPEAVAALVGGPDSRRPDPVNTVDPVLVERALGGQPVALTPAELHYAVVTGRAVGRGFKALAAVLGVTRHRVETLAATPLPDSYDVGAYALAA